MTATTKPKVEPFYMVWQTPRGGRIVKLQEDEQGSIDREAEYEVSNGFCTCDGFKYRKKCSHLGLVGDPPDGVPMSLAEARGAVYELIQRFLPEFRSVDLLDEPYERDEDGNVICASVVMTGDLYEDSLLTPGTWVGVLRAPAPALKVRMIVKE